MKVEIWSDVMCPFCYIGKRRFEHALASFDHKNEVEVEWKSFQLNPLLKTDTSVSIHDYLAESKGWQPEYARQVSEQVTEMAAGVGLTYNMDQAVVANSFNAHRFAHYAKKHGLGIEAEEALFKAYFTDGKNMDDVPTIAEIGSSIGLNADKVMQALEADTQLTEGVYHDLREAEEFGITGVPFFVFDRKYAISGAQPEVVFEDALKQAYQDQAVAQVAIANSCDADGENC